MLKWITKNIAYVSWTKQWKGICIHRFYPDYVFNLYLWGFNFYLKNPFKGSD